MLIPFDDLHDLSVARPELRGAARRDAGRNLRSDMSQRVILFPHDDEPFADFMQRQAPSGWTIKPVGPGSYEIKTADGARATVGRAGISAGWSASVRDTGINYEFTVTSPDGHEFFFHDCWQP